MGPFGELRPCSPWTNPVWATRLAAPFATSGLPPIMPRSPRRTAAWKSKIPGHIRSEEHTSELQSPDHLVCRLLLEKKKKTNARKNDHIIVCCSTSTHSVNALNIEHIGLASAV